VLRATARPVDYASGTFQMYIDAKYKAIQTLAATGNLDAQRVSLYLRWSKRLVIPGLAGFEEDRALQYLTTGTTVQTRDNRISGTYNFTLDTKLWDFLDQRITVAYNSQCCGVAVDFHTSPQPLLGVPSNRTLAVSFTLAGIGSFSNPLGSFGAH